MTGDGLAALERRAAADLDRIAYPRGAWVPPRHDADGRRVLDVLVVGGGQGGVAVAHGLLRARVGSFRIVDRAERGREGPWLTYARMATLRSPKEVNGPDLDVPSLTFQSWFEAQHGGPAWSALNKRTGPPICCGCAESWASTSRTGSSFAGSSRRASICARPWCIWPTGGSRP